MEMNICPREQTPDLADNQISMPFDVTFLATKEIPNEEEMPDRFSLLLSESDKHFIILLWLELTYSENYKVGPAYGVSLVDYLIYIWGIIFFFRN